MNNKEWREKYLSEIDTITTNKLVTPLSNMPKIYKHSFWVVLNIAVMCFCVLLSFLFALLYDTYQLWYFAWLDGLFLNLSIGLVASLYLLLSSNQKDKNVLFYSENLDLMNLQYDKLMEAKGASLGRLMKNLSYNDIEKATFDAKNVFEFSFCTINFFEIMLPRLRKNSKLFKKYKDDIIDEKKRELINLYKDFEKELFSTKQVSRKTLEDILYYDNIADNMLSKFKIYIENVEMALYNNKYGKTIKYKKRK